MAFVEYRRAERSVTFRDEANPTLHRLVASPVPLHYADGGGNFQRIDMSPVRINPGGWQKYPNFDGWLVSQNGWLYGLGVDGFVYFGGRRGEHYVRFRLREIGYVRTTTGAFTPISGLPDYNTANLSANQTQTTIEGETYTVGTTAEWHDLLSAGGGELFLRFRARGDGLKSEYVITQAAREWIIANRPPAVYGIPAAQAYLAFRFDVDFSDIPRKLVNGILQGDTFDDSAGGVELRNALDELLAFMPIGDAYVATDEPFQDKVALRKRFNGSIMTMGAAVAALNALPAGDLIFDPTITPSVSTGADDWTWITGTNFGNTEAGAIYGYYLATYLVHLGLRFSAVNVPKDSTINTCYVTGVASVSLSGTMSAVRVDFVAADNPSAPGNYTDAEAQTGTGSYASWTPGAQTAGTSYNTPSLVTPAQAIVNRAGWLPNQAMIVIIKAVTAANNYRSMASENHASYPAPLLYMDFTPPPITGTSDVTLGGDTTAGAGTVLVNGTSAVTLDGDTTAGVGNVPVNGTSAVVLDDDTTAGAGNVPINGTSDVTLDGDTTAGAGNVAISGVSDVTLDDDATAGAGVVLVNGTSDVTLDDDATTGAGVVLVNGTSDVTLDGDTTGGAGIVPVNGTSDVTLDGDTTAGAGVVLVNGTSDVTLDGDTTAGAGNVAISGASDVTLDGDTTTGAGIVPVNGTSDVTLNDDTTAGSGSVITGIGGYSDVTLDDDATAGAGVVLVNGTSAVTLDGDTTTGAGVVGETVEAVVIYVYVPLLSEGYFSPTVPSGAYAPEWLWRDYAPTKPEGDYAPAIRPGYYKVARQ